MIERHIKNHISCKFVTYDGQSEGFRNKLNQVVSEIDNIFEISMVFIVPTERITNFHRKGF